MKVIVTGFPARYKSFRQATAADDWMLPFLRPDDGDGTIDIKLNK